MSMVTSLLVLAWLCVSLVIAQNVCEKDGLLFNESDTIKENCNICTCVQLSGVPVQYGFRCTDKCLIQPRIIDVVNNGKYSWRASNYSQFWGLTLTDGVRYKLGTFPPEYDLNQMTSVQVNHQDSGSIPLSFDARDKWQNLIQPPQDQGNCGASWAFSTAAVASDRVSIETKGRHKDVLSPQHLLSCAQYHEDGCRGGHLDRAWNYIRRKGILSDNCYNYKSGQTKSAGKCFHNRKTTRWCSLIPEFIYTTPAYRIANKETDIMVEIMKNGPVQSLMKVNEDFFMYKSGIYRALTNGRRNTSKDDGVGYHSVRIIGWGEKTLENGEKIKYWLCVNSWGSQWGEDGYFKIERGQFESFTVASHFSSVVNNIPPRAWWYEERRVPGISRPIDNKSDYFDALEDEETEEEPEAVIVTKELYKTGRRRGRKGRH